MKVNFWIKPTEHSQSYCSNCRLTPKTIFGKLPPYCPNCGVKMLNTDWVDNDKGILLSHLEDYLKSIEEKI